MKAFIIAIFIYILIPGYISASQETIFIVESYHWDYPWDISYKKGLYDVLGSRFKIASYEMNTKKIPVSDFQKRADLAWQKYEKIRPSLVILADDNALKYLGHRFFGTSIPVVYLGINNNPRNYGMLGHKNITGVLERPLFKRSIKTISSFLNIKKVLVLFDSGTTSKIVKQETFFGKDTLIFSKIRTDIKLIGNLNLWKKEVLESKKNGYDIILVGLYHTIRDDSGIHVNEDEIIKWTSKYTPVPPFAFWDFAVGSEKTIGGYVLVGREEGKLAGQLALEMLSNKNHGMILPKPAEKGRLYFSWFQLRKWGVKIKNKSMGEAEFTE